jgi:hypothetical protein
VYRIGSTRTGTTLAHVVFGGVAFIALWTLLLRDHPGEVYAGGVWVWWTVLCVLAVVNACGWHRKALQVVSESASAAPLVYRFQWWQLALSAVFVFGCGFRSIFPRADVQRIGLIDSWLSSVLLGRSVATVAELCFMAQWALLLRRAAEDVRSPFGIAVSRLIVPFIAVAEVCSWYAVLTTCYLGNAVEESIWALTASLLVVSCLIIWMRSRAARRPFLAAALLLGTLYVGFMCTVDIPMYLSRWQADEASGRAYLTVDQGLVDAWSRRVVTFSWAEWRPEVPWMTLYFSVCVWWSLALVHAPRLAPAPVHAPECESL